LGKRLSIPSPDSGTLSLFIPKLDLDTGYEPRGGEEVVIAVDSTGIKVTNRGEWMRRKKNVFAAYERRCLGLGSEKPTYFAVFVKSDTSSGGTGIGQ
jgi:hypothetical protein